MKLSIQLKRVLILSFSVLYLAGGIYWLFRLCFRRAGDFGEEPHMIERFSGPIHLLAGFVFLFVIGIVWAKHVDVALRMNRHRVSGWLFLALVAILTGSGVSLVYGGPLITKAVEFFHPAVGAIMFPLYLFHWKFRKHRRFPGQGRNNAKRFRLRHLKRRQKKIRA